jgi:hypothetical protein
MTGSQILPTPDFFSPSIKVASSGSKNHVPEQQENG